MPRPTLRDTYGGTPAIETNDTPTPPAGEALVRVAAASFNPLIVKLQQSYVEAFFPVEFPPTIGTDVAGTIEGFGGEAGSFTTGDRIIARMAPTAGGTLVEYVIALVDHLVRVGAVAEMNEWPKVGSWK